MSCRSCSARLSVAVALARMRSGFLVYLLARSLAQRTTAAAPSQIGELSITLIGGAIMGALRYRSRVIGMWNIAFGFCIAFWCALMLNGAKASRGVLYSSW